MFQNQATIPVLNLQDFFQPELRSKFVADLDAAFRTLGFVAVVNTGINMQLLDQAYSSAAKFFAQPDDYKLAVTKPELAGQRGYIRSEFAKGQAKKDFKEHYHIGRDQNLWPHDMPEFAPNMQSLFTEMERSIAPILEAISIAMQQPKDYLGNMTAQGQSLIRALHYPPNAPTDVPWAAAHTDIDLISVIPRSTAAGLQVLHANGTWIDVVVPEGAFIVNAGDMLQNLTNGEFKSSVHRVVNKNPLERRYSMVLFSHPRSEVDLTPLPQYIARHGQQKYPKATQSELLMERLVDLGLAPDEMKRQLAESGLVQRMQALNMASPKVIEELRVFIKPKPKL